METMMTYEEALDYLNAPVYSQIRPGLGPVTELMEILDNPQDGMKYVHITGTNGKGSTAAYIDSALRKAGYKTGLYTSPFIQRFTERIQVAGEEIPQDDLARITERVKDAVAIMNGRGHTSPTIFELITAVAFLYFREKNCDIVILEVGMGGRLDATNIIHDSEVSVITTIDYDHMQFLGNTLEEIAHEKAGIVKPGGSLVCYPQQPGPMEVIRRRCEEMKADLQVVDLDAIEVVSSDIDGQSYRLHGQEIEITKLGVYQIYNSAVAYTALKVLQRKGWKLTDQNILDGLRDAKWMGRLEIVHRDPLVLIDGAHNPNGVDGLVKSLKTIFPDRKLVFVAGVLADKDYLTMFREIEPLAKCFLTVTPNSHRALAGADLAAQLRADGFEAENFATVPEAVEAAMDRYPEDVICAFGSLYYIGDVRTYMTEQREGK